MIKLIILGNKKAADFSAASIYHFPFTIHFLCIPVLAHHPKLIVKMPAAR